MAARRALLVPELMEENEKFVNGKKKSWKLIREVTGRRLEIMTGENSSLSGFEGLLATKFGNVY